MLGWIMGTKLGRGLSAALAALVTVWWIYTDARSKGRKEAERDAREADHERADEVREKAAQARDNGPRSVDDADRVLRDRGRLRD